MRGVKLALRRLLNFKILLADVHKHRTDVTHGGVYVLFHDGTVDTASVAGRHFDKALVYAALLNVPQSIETALCAVDGEVLVAIGLIHAGEYSAGDREAPRSAGDAFAELLFDLDLCGKTHLVELLKGENGVNAGADSLLLLGNTGTDEHDLCVGNALFYVLCVGDHRGDDGSEILLQVREMLFNKQIYRGTAGAYNDVLLTDLEHMLVLTLHDGCADGGLLGVGKAQLTQSLAYGIYTAALPAGVEGGGDACDNGGAALQHNLDPFGVVNYLLGVLRADDEALTAEDALVLDDAGLVAGKADSLDRAAANTAMAVFAV